MSASPSLDFVGYGLFLGFFALCIFLTAVTVVEGVVLRNTGWVLPRRPFLDAFIMNIVSTILGALFLSSVSGMVSLLNLGQFAEFSVLMIIAWGISIVSEAITLILLRKVSWRSVIRPVFFANIASYVLIFIWAYVTGGGY
jgi:hypothetical protein